MFILSLLICAVLSNRLFEQKLFAAIDHAIDDVFEEEYGSLSDSSEYDSSEEIAVGSSDSDDFLPKNSEVNREEFDALTELVHRLQASMVHETAVGGFSVDYRIIFMIDASGSMTGNYVDTFGKPVMGAGYDAATGRTRWEKTLSWLAHWRPWPIGAKAETQIWKFDNTLNQVTDGWTKMSTLDPWADTVCAITPQNGATFTDDAIGKAVSEFTSIYTEKGYRSSEEYAYMLFIMTDGFPSKTHGVCPGTPNLGPKTFTQNGLFAGGPGVPNIQSFIFGVDTELGEDFPDACWPAQYKAEVNSAALTMNKVSDAIHVADKEEDVCAMLQLKIRRQAPFQDFGVAKSKIAFHECKMLEGTGYCTAVEGKNGVDTWEQDTTCATVKTFKYSMKAAGAAPVNVNNAICQGKPGDVDPKTGKPFAPAKADQN